MKNFRKYMRTLNNDIIFENEDANFYANPIMDKIISKLEGFSYCDDYVRQSCAENILNSRSKMQDILFDIEDEDISVSRAVIRAMKKEELSYYSL